MKKRIALALITVMTMLLLAGCGEKMYGLTPESERLAANYSAKMVAKYNKKHDEGICYVLPEKLAEVETAVDTNRDMTDDEQQIETEDEQEVDTDEATDSGAIIDASDVSAGDMADAAVIEQGTGVMPVNPGAPVTHITPTGQATTLGDTLGYPQLSITVEDIFIADDYKEGSYFMMSPSAGNKYIVCYVSLENNSGSEVECNIAATGAKFVATMGDGTVAESINAFLGDDFGQFSGQIGNGVMVSTVALIEIPASYAEDLYGMKLRLEAADGSYCDVY